MIISYNDGIDQNCFRAFVQRKTVVLYYYFCGITNQYLVANIIIIVISILGLGGVVSRYVAVHFLRLKYLFIFEFPGILTVWWAHLFESEYGTITHSCIPYLFGVALPVVILGLLSTHQFSLRLHLSLGLL